MTRPLALLTLLAIAACGIDGDFEADFEAEANHLLDPLFEQQRQDCVVEINASIQAELDRIRFCSARTGCALPLFDVGFPAELMLEPARSVTVVKAETSGLFWGHLERAADAPELYDLFWVDAAVAPESFEQEDLDEGGYTISYTTNASHIRFPVATISVQLARAWAVLGSELVQREGPQAWYGGDDWESIEIVTDLARRGLRKNRENGGDIDSVELVRWILLYDFVNSLQTAADPEDDLPVDDPRIADRLLRWMSDELAEIRRHPKIGRPARFLASQLGLELPDDHGRLRTHYVIAPGVATYPQKPLCADLLP